MTWNQLLSMRMQKKRPASWVIVSLIGDLPSETDPVITLKSRPEKIDWRPLTGLDVVVFHKQNTRHDAFCEVLNCIIRVHPQTLAAWMPDSAIGYDLVDCGGRVFARWEAKRECEWENLECT